MVNNILSINRTKSNKPDQGRFASPLQPSERVALGMVTQTACTVTDILPNQTGRLRYLATEWNARSIDNSFIPASTTVHPVMRKGNTWFVSADFSAEFEVFDQQAA